MTESNYHTLYTVCADNLKPLVDEQKTFLVGFSGGRDSHVLLDIMVRLKDIAASKDKILIFNWYFHEDDNDMFEAGQNFSKMIGFPFNFVMYK